MKKESAVKYPNSANLFQFCRKVLDHKFGGIRVIDQDVGQILGFDPADCSHWKKGKKNIRSIQAIKTIAEHLGVDEELIVDIASGDLDVQEAFYEYCGYGLFFVDTKLLDAAKKEFYRKNANTWTREKELEFKEYFNINEPRIDEIVAEIHTKINYEEAPLYLPEIVANFNDIQMIPIDLPADSEESVTYMMTKDGKIEIKFPTDEKMRPYVRYQISKAMASYFFSKNDLKVTNKLENYTDHVMDIQSNLFAAKLLTPARLIRKELANVNIAKDIIAQLAEVFWVSKTFMNRRLKEVIQKTP
ncbi:MAG: hypothetical protein HQK54_10735, partial [Oligoflexales bacterium]|nr:hypothetical protein [Oligoflexales bacterium]